MHKSTLAGFIVLLLALCSSPLHADDALRDRILTRLANQPDKHFQFRQEKKLAMLAQPLVTQGTLQVDQQHRVIWNIQQPYQLRYELTRDEIREIDAQGTRSIKPGQNPIAAALTEALTATFSGHWEAQANLAYLSAAGNDDHWQLTITPVADALTPILQTIVVEGDQSTVQQIHITETNGDNTDIRLAPITP